MRLGLAISFTFLFCCISFAQNTNIYRVRLSAPNALQQLEIKNISFLSSFRNPQNSDFLNSFVDLVNAKPSQLEELKEDGIILYWESTRLQELYFTPSDESYHKQWYLSKISAPEVWDITQGDSTYFVGVVDSGVDYNHEDLVGNLAYNHSDPINGIDDDNDGYIDNYYGWDFGANDSDPMIDGGSFFAHGSTMCGIIAAQTNNNEGTASTAFNCRYLPVKITDVSGQIIDTNAGILYAAQMGAQVINCSFGSTDFSQEEADIITYVTDSLDVLVIASAGNNGLNIPVYPASLYNVIGVCATDEMDVKVSISNYHSSFDISAPGYSIYAPYIENEYSFKSGTSVAAAVVSSAAILLRSYFTLEDATEIRNRLLNSTDYINDLNPQHYLGLGTGRLNLLSAFSEIEKTALITIPNPSNGEFDLLLELPDYANYQISIFDVLGKLYHRTDFFARSKSHTEHLNLQDIKQGYYTVEILGANYHNSSGIIIVK
jgi:subtilisin family serine protease